MAVANNAEEFIAKQRMAVASSPECGTSHYNLAVALLGQQKYDEAEEELMDAVECSPNLAEAYVQLGGLCFRRGDLEGCLSYNKQAVHSRAGFFEGYGNIGFVYLQMGKIDESIAALEKAIRWNPNFIQAITTLANAYLMQDRVEDSIKMGQRAIALESNFAVAHNNLAIAYLENGQHDLAAEHCDKAVSLGYEVSPEILAEIEKHR
jgi:tetratricopeptide (TPR) repeat protein